jgi:hypothetical protein
MGEHKRRGVRRSRYLNELGTHTQLGVLVGLAMAALYCAIALFIFLLRGSVPFDRNEVTLSALLATYVAAGLAGGLVYGLLHPLGRSLPGRVVLGVVIAAVVYAGVSVAVKGPPAGWGRREWRAVLSLGVIMGVPAGLLWKRVTSR